MLQYQKEHPFGFSFTSKKEGENYEKKSKENYICLAVFDFCYAGFGVQPNKQENGKSGYPGR